MRDRQEIIFKDLVEDYIERASPVSSFHLVHSYRLPWSTATVRNDLLDLEEEGFLEQPHHSSGRIPTEKGYRYFVDYLLDEVEPNKKAVRGVFERLAKNRVSGDTLLLEAIEALAEASGAVSFALSRQRQNTFFYGLGEVFEEPEFQDADEVKKFGRLIDRLQEEFFEVFYSSASFQPQVLIGRENPFPEAEHASIVLAGIGKKRSDGVLVGLVGPQRMDYAKNQALLKYCKNFFEQDI